MYQRKKKETEIKYIKNVKLNGLHIYNTNLYIKPHRDQK